MRFANGGRSNKDQVAKSIAERFPELHDWLPPIQKYPAREHYRMSIFDAAALVLTYFAVNKTK